MGRKATERGKIRMREYYHAHKEEATAQNKAWRASHPEETRAAGRRRSRSKGGRFSSLKNAAKRNEREMSLSFDEYLNLIAKPCFYCNGNLSEAGYGLDRIDCNHGYSLNNVRPCCRDCNVAKSSMSETQFKEWVIQIYKHWIIEK